MLKVLTWRQPLSTQQPEALQRGGRQPSAHHLHDFQFSPHSTEQPQHLFCFGHAARTDGSSVGDNVGFNGSNCAVFEPRFQMVE